MNTAAFFDIDGTLYRNSLMIEHFHLLVKYELIDPMYWHQSVKKIYTDWRKRKAEYDDYMLRLVDIYYQALKGMNARELDFLSKQVIEKNGDIVYRYTRERIQYHKNAGHLIFFISGSPDFLVSKMAEKYQADEYLGTKYLTDDDGKFTGKVVPMWDAASKRKAIQRLQKTYPIDLSSSYAYGDTSGDFSMLSMVGHPIAINPAYELLSRIQSVPALAAKTTVIVERKDVIYRLNAAVETLILGD